MEGAEAGQAWAPRRARGGVGAETRGTALGASRPPFILLAPGLGFLRATVSRASALAQVPPRCPQGPRSPQETSFSFFVFFFFGMLTAASFHFLRPRGLRDEKGKIETLASTVEVHVALTPSEKFKNWAGGEGKGPPPPGRRPRERRGSGAPRGA